MFLMCYFFLCGLLSIHKNKYSPRLLLWILLCSALVLLCMKVLVHALPRCSSYFSLTVFPGISDESLWPCIIMHHLIPLLPVNWVFSFFLLGEPSCFVMNRCDFLWADGILMNSTKDILMWRLENSCNCHFLWRQGESIWICSVRDRVHKDMVIVA